MTQKNLFMHGKAAKIPRARSRAHIAQAMALAVLTICLPAQGYSSNINGVSAQGHNDAARDDRNSHPVAVTDYVALKNATQAFNILANDTDADKDTLILVEATAQYGAVAFTSDGLVAYAPNSTQPRADEINYVLSDGRGGRANGKVIVAVR
ncbi:Ig-like domain-containing protein [Sphingorhabdus sp.]|uniref:Ig-like domain-containing protein n=1 Tax=Sphingorhabdus sp. TaxID=1902408 RepID=UPI00391922E1